MSSKIDVRQIFSDHIFTLRHASGHKLNLLDLFVFFIVPFILGCFSFYFEFSFSDSAYTILITAFSVFVGLLINVLVLIYSIFQNFSPVSQSDDEAVREKKKWERILLKEIFSNVSYANLIAILAILIISTTQFVSLSFPVVFSSVIVFISANFILTLLMIIKRIHNLIRNKLDQHQE
ncbi:MAG: hypothetical protein HQL98_03300 [Magnetococcales bacterium]|nr:hypothetical protein [Magnetococcales bacterium]